MSKITRDEKNNFLKEMENNKAPGVDVISMEGIKVGREALLDKIKNLFNVCSHNGSGSENWNKIKMIMIHKNFDINSIKIINP